jgi:hypothetical protein
LKIIGLLMPVFFRRLLFRATLLQVARTSGPRRECQVPQPASN